MHGLVLKAVEIFVVDQYGDASWHKVMQAGSFDVDEFEPMLIYDQQLGQQMGTALEAVLERPLSDICEDLGTYLVTNPKTDRLWRLLRFGGDSLEDFLHSLNDLPDRVRLAMPDFILPKIDLREHSFHYFSVRCTGDIPGFGHVLAGVLRAMIDDFGALAMVEHRGGGQGIETIGITLLERSFTEGRDFELWGTVA